MLSSCQQRNLEMSLLNNTSMCAENITSAAMNKNCRSNFAIESDNKCEEHCLNETYLPRTGIELREEYRDEQYFHIQVQNLEKKTESQLCMEFQTHQHTYRRHQRSQKFVIRRKRRTVFNTQQTLILEKIFKKKPYVNREERHVLMRILNVNDRSIKVWFQNRRRLSSRKDIEPSVNYNSDSSVEENVSNLSLDYVESIMKEADEFGYVTLNDRALRELFTVIDSRLKGVELSEPSIELKEETNTNTVYYEPISPVSMHDGSDEITHIHDWEPYEPEASLRRLFDVQSLIKTSSLKYIK